MLGEKVPKEELEELLIEERKKSELINELNKELKALRPGECLAYEVKVGLESALSLSLSLTPVKKLKIITRTGKVYAYKER